MSPCSLTGAGRRSIPSAGRCGPHLMDDTTSRVIRELVEPPVSPRETRGRPPAGARHGRPTSDVGRRATTLAESGASGESAAAAGLPRPVGRGPTRRRTRYPTPEPSRCRLLTPTPRLEGLGARRSRRTGRVGPSSSWPTWPCTRGEEVTSDRLRTRVLGSSDADAASKTLFNIATAARRAMGTDATGTPLFPPARRTGHYRVAEGVTTDVHRAASLALAGQRTEDPDTAMGLLRSALSLVEGEPMANALSGYAWWEAEGHGARIAAVLVNAASDLAALAVEAELFELAQWGLAKARLVDPYSEAISRAAMQVAAAAGDGDRLRREWRECRRRMDELDPGSAPSARTERLYGELAQLVLVGARTADL